MVRKTLKRDMEMLELLAVTDKKIVAETFELTLRGLDSWLHRVRERRREFRWYLNKMLGLEKRNARLRKILLSGKLKIEDQEEWE